MAAAISDSGGASYYVPYLIISFAQIKGETDRTGFAEFPFRTEQKINKNSKYRCSAPANAKNALIVVRV